MFTVFTFSIGSQMEKRQQKFENADLESVIE